MNLIDQLKKMKKKGRHVVAIDYVLKKIELSNMENREEKQNEK